METCIKSSGPSWYKCKMYVDGSTLLPKVLELPLVTGVQELDVQELSPKIHVYYKKCKHQL